MFDVTPTCQRPPLHAAKSELLLTTAHGLQRGIPQGPSVQAVPGTAEQEELFAGPGEELVVAPSYFGPRSSIQKTRHSWVRSFAMSVVRVAEYVRPLVFDPEGQKHLPCSGDAALLQNAIPPCWSVG